MGRSSQPILLQKPSLRACPLADEYRNTVSSKACSRCGGLFNREWPLTDVGGGKEFFHSGVLLYSLRCTSCGEVVDPMILKNRALQARLASEGKKMIAFGKRASRRRKSPVSILL